MKIIISIFTLCCCALLSSCNNDNDKESTSPEGSPNFLFILTDDQSAHHTSKAGYSQVSTPNFDQLANEGVYFQNAYAAAPTCTASRSAVLSGQHIWRLGSGANLWGQWSDSMSSYQMILQQNGYQTAYTGKGWGPGYQAPVGHVGAPVFKHARFVGCNMSKNDYTKNLEEFLNNRNTDKPFSFWLGTYEPHKPYDSDDGSRFDGVPVSEYLPDHLPKTPAVDKDLQSYLEEIEQVDSDLGEIVDLLEAQGLLDNTIIIISSDNGMPFSRGKLNNYLHGVQVPLVVYWPKGMAGQREVQQVVSLTDIAPTLFEAAGVSIPNNITGKSLLPLITNTNPTWDREEVFSAFERHSNSVRPNGEGYPRRALHQQEWLYIRNLFPDRWPLGNPDHYGEAFISYFYDPISNSHLQPYMGYSVDQRPYEELYYLPTDPSQLVNLADNPSYSHILNQLSGKMDLELLQTDDPTFATGVDTFSLYQYFKPVNNDPNTDPDPTPDPIPDPNDPNPPPASLCP